MFPKDLIAYAKFDALKFEKDQRLSDEIRHIKCPIIKLVKRQIENAEIIVSGPYVLCQRNRSLKHKLWRKRWTILKWVLLILVMICLFIYGALLGAGLCSCSISQHSLPCSGTFSLIPGLNFAKRQTFIY